MAHIQRLCDPCEGAYGVGFHGLGRAGVIGPEAPEEGVLEHEMPGDPEPRPKGDRNPNARDGLAGAGVKFLPKQASQRQVSFQEGLGLGARWDFGRRMPELGQALEMT